ncbi:hypothetical protein BDZ91DRAFT_793902 [Kalaharituber pfeilii]|nr:hypothetical protein BDZ91DRAFT_793902 [Kalaharituber pfeilii]
MAGKAKRGRTESRIDPCRFKSMSRHERKPRPKVNNIEFHYIQNWKSRENITLIQKDQQWTLHKFQDIIRHTRANEPEEARRLEDATTWAVGQGKFPTATEYEGPVRNITLEDIQEGRVTMPKIIAFIEKSDAMDPLSPEDQIEETIELGTRPPLPDHPEIWKVDDLEEEQFLIEAARAAVNKTREWENKAKNGSMKTEMARHIGASAAEALRALEKKFGLTNWKAQEWRARDELNTNMDQYTAEVKAHTETQIEQAKSAIINSLTRSVEKRINELRALMNERLDCVTEAMTTNMDCTDLKPRWPDPNPRPRRRSNHFEGRKSGNQQAAETSNKQLALNPDKLTTEEGGSQMDRDYTYTSLADSRHAIPRICSSSVPATIGRAELIEDVTYSHTKLTDSKHTHTTMIERKEKDMEMHDAMPASTGATPPMPQETKGGPKLVGNPCRAKEERTAKANLQQRHPRREQHQRSRRRHRPKKKTISAPGDGPYKTIETDKKTYAAAATIQGDSKEMVHIVHIPTKPKYKQTSPKSDTRSEPIPKTNYGKQDYTMPTTGRKNGDTQQKATGRWSPKSGESTKT